MINLNYLADSVSSIVTWAIIGGVCAVLLIAVILISHFSKKRKLAKASEEIDRTSSTLNRDDFLACLGGVDNIVSYTIRGSRITVVLKDYSLLNKEKFNDCGIESSVLMSEKIVLVSKIAPALHAILAANVPLSEQ